MEILAATASVTRAARASRRHRSTWYRWRTERPAFAAAWAEAVERGTDALEDEAIRRAVEGVLKPVFHQGKRVGTQRVFSDPLFLNIVKQGKHTIWVPAGAMTRLTTGAPCGSLTTYGTQYGQYDGLPFAQGVVQQAGVWAAMPKSWDQQSTVEVVPVWSVDGAVTGNVAWRAKINARGDGDNIGSAFDATPAKVVDSAGGVQGRLLVGASIVATGPIVGAAESDLLFIVVERVGNDSEDTLGASAILRGVKILYSINKSRDN